MNTNTAGTTSEANRGMFLPKSFVKTNKVQFKTLNSIAYLSSGGRTFVFGWGWYNVGIRI